MIFKRLRNKKSKDNSAKKKPARRGSLGPSILTGEVVIDGHLLSGGELQIDGEVNGDVRARAVVIDVNGVVHGEVAAEDVFIRGRIIGPIRGLHVHILNGAHVEGDVLNETISIENGASVDGKIHRVDNPLDDAYSRNQEQLTSHYIAPPAPHQSKYNFDNGGSFITTSSDLSDKNEVED